MRKLSLIWVFLLGLSLGLVAQPAQKKVQVILYPDHADGLYAVGEKVKMKVVVLDCGMPLNDAVVHYEVSEDLMPAHVQEQVQLNGCEGKFSKVVRTQTFPPWGLTRIGWCRR